MTQNRKTEAEIQAFLAGYTPQVQAIALELRELVFSVAPNAAEQIDMPARLLGYGFAATYKDTICVIMPLKSAVNLGFPRGTELLDPAGLLAGTGKRARHAKLTDVKDVAAPALRALLEASVAQLLKK
ncbi:MAG: DUF1801 domain-containing protein [Chloroflexi bacterium]|nr:DUF1801 domain-containing protein [Chloroflexota bacterium]MCI0579812.1 DUF1801 domain-containing protein [Chloroflexota bacterium]MCI0647248.1 DUF1801 domain-containing protein [Chloroflexota bacterium]MCI0728902.1 DUF1801 domain-containing protein [Chloroflexota bacterium]